MEATPHRDHKNCMSGIARGLLVLTQVHNGRKIKHKRLCLFFFLDVETSSFLDFERDFLDPLLCIC